jgi:hypothetical protein
MSSKQAKKSNKDGGDCKVYAVTSEWTSYDEEDGLKIESLHASEDSAALAIRKMFDANDCQFKHYYDECMKEKKKGSPSKKGKKLLGVDVASAGDYGPSFECSVNKSGNPVSLQCDHSAVSGGANQKLHIVAMPIKGRLDAEKPAVFIFEYVVDDSGAEDGPMYNEVVSTTLFAASRGAQAPSAKMATSAFETQLGKHSELDLRVGDKGAWVVCKKMITSAEKGVAHIANRM